MGGPDGAIFFTRGTTHADWRAASRGYFLFNRDGSKGVSDLEKNLHRGAPGRLRRRHSFRAGVQADTQPTRVKNDGTGLEVGGRLRHLPRPAGTGGAEDSGARAVGRQN